MKSHPKSFARRASSIRRDARGFRPTRLRCLRASSPCRARSSRPGLDPHKVVDVVTRRAQELTHSTGAVVELLDGDELVYWSASGNVASQLGTARASATAASRACASRPAACCSATTARPIRASTSKRAAASGLRSMLVAPLPYGDTIIGVLKVVAPWIDAYQPEDVRTLELLNTLIGATLSHAAHHTSVEAAFNSKIEADRLVADEREELRQRIRGIIEREAFDIAFQPVLALESGAIVGFEALARFTRCAFAVARPLVRRRAAGRAQLRARNRRHAQGAGVAGAVCRANTYLAINVSPETAASSELARLCTRHAADRIVLEITEHSERRRLSRCLPSARVRCASMGVHLAIDDAGAGFASLRHVLRLEPDLIKLDKSITRNIDKRVRHQSLAAALLTFASGTSASIVAEGIETRRRARDAEAPRRPVRSGLLPRAARPLPDDQRRSADLDGQAARPRRPRRRCVHCVSDACSAPMPSHRRDPSRRAPWRVLSSASAVSLQAPCVDDGSASHFSVATLWSASALRSRRRSARRLPW